MDEKTVKAIQDALTPLAEKLGEGASHVYELYVKQIVVEGAVAIVIALFFVFVVIPASFVIAHRVEKSLGTYDKGIAYMSAGVLALVLMVVTITFAYTAPMKLMNPEYYAIERLLDNVRGN